MLREEPSDALSGRSGGMAPLVTNAPAWERRGLVGAGMLGACLLGAVAGVWARPHEDGELARVTAARAAYGPMPSQLQVVIEPDLRPPLEGPLPIAAGAAPVSVAPTVPAPPILAQPSAPVVAAAAVEPKAPVADRVNVKAPEPPAHKAKVETKVAEPRRREPEPEPKRLAKAESAADKTQKTPIARTEAKPDEAVEKEKARQAWLAKVERRKAAERAERAERAEKVELAKTEAADKKAAARLAWLAKVERLKAEDRAKTHKSKLAKADKPPQAAPPKPAQPKPTAQLAAARPAPPRPGAVNAPSSTLDLQLAALRAEPLKAAAAAPVKVSAPIPPARPPVVAHKPAPAPVARSCEADSRAEELVCADPRLAAADRRLSSAYRRALQAGASPDRLRRQQGAWLAARAQAADEAPWALARVYDVRIAELNDEAEQAEQGN